VAEEKPIDKEIIERTLDALDRLMRMFQVERIVYLACAITSFGLLIYAGYIMAKTNDVTIEQLGMMFGATGIVTISATRVSYFLNKSFNLMEDVIRRVSGLENIR
jgi:hypothetical protein